jgi:hypothetical protein
VRFRGRRGCPLVRLLCVGVAVAIRTALTSSDAGLYSRGGCTESWRTLRLQERTSRHPGRCGRRLTTIAFSDSWLLVRDGERWQTYSRHSVIELGRLTVGWVFARVVVRRPPTGRSRSACAGACAAAVLVRVLIAACLSSRALPGAGWVSACCPFVVCAGGLSCFVLCHMSGTLVLVLQSAIRWLVVRGCLVCEALDDCCGAWRTRRVRLVRASFGPMVALGCPRPSQRVCPRPCPRCSLGVG